jgi:succinate-semialdehyde dehydrogenase / glutarate-semialdehyde dehydrogenase
MRFEVIDPSTGRTVRVVPGHDPGQVEARLDAAARAAEAWRDTDPADRAEALRGLAAQLEERSDELALTMAEEMGKPVAQGVAEARKCAWVCRHYATHGPGWLLDEPAESDGQAAWIRHDPLGVVLAIMPWNYPAWQLLRFAAPGLMAGNAFLLKHAPNTPGVALALEGLFDELDVPEGLARVLLVDVETTGEVLDDDRVAAVTLTGSTGAGRSVAARAGRALKPSVLELGGSDPFIVLPDADVDEAARVAAKARLLNSGQSCIAAKRFIVVEAVADRFVQAFGHHLRAARVGDPRDPETEVGPQARRDLRGALHRQVRDSVDAGAVCQFGGEIPDGDGFFYPVTLLTGAAPGMPCWDEEIFGPVAAVRTVSDADAALEAANDTRYGLGASVWTSDRRTAERFIAGIRAGSVFVNGLVKSDPRLPFGGIRESGYGRELGRDGVMSFVNRKTVWLGPGV